MLGVHSGAASSVYAQCVTEDCFDHLQITGIEYKITFELGPAVYGGWTCMVVGLWSGIMLVCCNNFWRENNVTLKSEPFYSDSPNDVLAKTDIEDEKNLGVAGIYRQHMSLGNGSVKSKSHNSTMSSTPQSLSDVMNHHQQVYGMRKKLVGTDSSCDSGRAMSYRSTETVSCNQVFEPKKHSDTNGRRYNKNIGYGSHRSKYSSCRHKERVKSSTFSLGSAKFNDNSNEYQGQNIFYKTKPDSDDCISTISSLSLITTYL